MKILHASLFVLFVAASAAQSQEGSKGLEIFNTICATCHGLTGVGNGPMAPILLVQPTDLTALAKHNEGIFPVIRVIKRIDGRDPLVSHGSEMPVFGDFFGGKNNVRLQAKSGQSILVSEPVRDVIAYLQSIQK